MLSKISRNKTDEFSEEARYLEYNNNVVPSNEEQKPVSKSILSIYEDTNDTGIYVFNNDSLIKRIQPATSPNLLVSYIKLFNYSEFSHVINDGTSNVFFVIEGNGITETEYGNIKWSEGDIFVLPYCGNNIKHKSLEQRSTSSKNSVLLWANDTPLLRYLGVKPSDPIFNPVLYKHDELINNMNNINSVQNENSEGPNNNRNGVLLTNPEMISEKMNTITHTMWSLYNLIEPNTVQKPHKHNSVAIDYCISAGYNNVYTLMSKNIDDDGNLIDPIKMIWKTGCIFTTPPGWWHSHHNESSTEAYVFPLQDAGLHTFMNTLDIQFQK